MQILQNNRIPVTAVVGGRILRPYFLWRELL